MDELKRLIDVVARLRSPTDGCPWDSVQTNMSIRHYLVEEAGEYLDALEEGNDHAVMDELGDLLLQIVLNAQIAKDEGRFDIQDVARSEADKMIRRHPHVFGENAVKDKSEDALRSQWERIKHTEAGYSERKSAMDGIPRHIPGLQRAQKAVARSTRAGFKWPSIDGSMGKIDEELAEVHEALEKGDDNALAEEIGDLFFALVVLCHQKGFQSEEVMQAAVHKYMERFRCVEQEFAERGVVMKEAPIEELVASWKRAKKATHDKP